MTIPREERDGLLDRHIDGALTPDERDAFERVLAADPGLVAEVELHRSIEAGLRRTIRPVAVALPAQVAARIAAESAAPLAFRAPAKAARNQMAHHPYRWIAVAALLAMTAAGLWGVWSNYGPQPTPTLLVSAARIYELQRDRGFKPEWVCTTEKEFAKAVKDHVGQPLVVTAAQNVAIVGWAYPQEGYAGQEVALSRKTMILLTRVDDDPVIVLIDRVSRDRDINSPPDPTLHVYRRVVGDLVLYEVSPREKPALLDRFGIPDTR